MHTESEEEQQNHRYQVESQKVKVLIVWKQMATKNCEDQKVWERNSTLNYGKEYLLFPNTIFIKKRTSLCKISSQQSFINV